MKLQLLKKTNGNQSRDKLPAKEVKEIDLLEGLKAPSVVVVLGFEEPTSFFHLRTISLAKSAISLTAFCRSLFTVIPILVS